MPRVTVLMPAYNAERFIGEAIRSVLTQTYADFELVVVDDGSTDRTREALSTFGDSRIVVVENPRNLGVGESLNRGLSVATGELVAQHDSDDVSEPGRLARQVAFLDAHPDVAVVGSWYRKIDERGTLLGDRTLPFDSTRLAWAMLFYCPIVHSAAMYRRSIVLQQGGYDGRHAYAHDYDLWSRLAREHRLATLPEFLVRYRVGHASLTANVADDGGAAIALDNVRRLLAGVGHPAPTASEHQAMYNTLFRGQSASESALTVRAMEQIGVVLDAFCRQPNVDAAEAAALRAETQAVLRRR